MTKFQANGNAAGLSCLLAIVMHAPWSTGWLDLLAIAAQATLLYGIFDAERQDRKRAER